MDSSINTSWHFGDAEDAAVEEQELDFQVVSSSQGDEDDLGLLLDSPDDSLLQELFTKGKKSGQTRLAPISKSVSFDQGFVLAVRAIQYLRKTKREKNAKVKIIIGVGGPGGSGKTSLAHKIACVVGCTVVSVGNYLDASKGSAEENLETFGCLDGALLKANLEDILKDRDTDVPLFDYQKRERIGFRTLKASDCSVVILEGLFALHQDFSQYLDMRISVVGGVHYNLVKRVYRDLKKSKTNQNSESLNENSVLETIFSSYKEYIEPHLKGAHIMIKNDFDHLASLREPLYILKAKGEPTTDVGAIHDILSSHDFTHSSQGWIDTHIRLPGTERLKDWLRIRQCGGFYSITFCEWLVEGDFIISPRITFTTGHKTLGSLLNLGYEIGMSIKRSSDIFTNKEVTVCIDTVEDLQETHISIKGTNRQAVIATAKALGLHEDFVTQSSLELCLKERSSPKQNNNNTTTTSPAPPPEKAQASLPMRLMQAAAAAVTPNTATTHVVGSATTDRPSSPPLYSTGRNVELVPITKELSFDQGLLLAVRGVQKLREHRINTGLSRRLVIVGIGGPSGSGKSRLAGKMAELLNCEILEMEDYYIPSKICDDNFDEFDSLDTKLLCSHLEVMRKGEKVSVPQFDLTQKKRLGHRSFSPASGVVIVEGVYALHKNVRPFLDFRIGVVGGVHFNLVKRVHRDADRAGRSYSQNEVMERIFPLFREHIQPGLRHAHLRIRNSFDPLTSLQTPKYVLKAKSTLPEAKIKALEEKLGLKFEPRREDTYADIYLVLGSNKNGRREDWIRIRQCGGRYSVLFRDSLREGGFIIQPPLDFEVGVKTLAGLICLGYQMVALVEASVTHFVSDKLYITQEKIPLLRGETYTLIKSSSKQTVQLAAEELGLKPNDSTTKTFIELIRENIGLDQVPRSNSATELKDFLTRVTEHSPDETLTAARHDYEIREIKSELQRLNKLLTLTASMAGAVLIPLVGMMVSSYFMWYSTSKRIR
jgi:uridine kinase/adenylate cyclase class IV